MKLYKKIAILASLSISVCKAQNLVFEEVLRLGSEINTNKEDMRPYVTFDGSRMYFVRENYKKNRGGEAAGSDIWYSYVNKDVGTTAKNDLFRLNNEGDNAVVGVSADHQTLYLLNKYNKSGYPYPDGFGISYSKRKYDDWLMPKNLNIPNLVYTAGTYDFDMHSNEKMLIISYQGKGTIGKEDLYVSLSKDGNWSSPINLGSVVNSKYSEITPYLSHDTKVLYFSSDRPGGLGGQDIYMSKRLDDTWKNWSEPVNLGAPVNSEFYDGYFTLDDELEAHFSSNRTKKTDDIYFSQGIMLTDEEMALRLKEKLKDETIMMVGEEGFIIDDKSNLSIETDKKIVEEIKDSIVETKELEIGVEENSLLKEVEINEVENEKIIEMSIDSISETKIVIAGDDGSVADRINHSTDRANDIEVSEIAVTLTSKKKEKTELKKTETQIEERAGNNNIVSIRPENTIDSIKLKKNEVSVFTKNTVKNSIIIDSVIETENSVDLKKEVNNSVIEKSTSIKEITKEVIDEKDEVVEVGNNTPLNTIDKKEEISTQKEENKEVMITDSNSAVIADVKKLKNEVENTILDKKKVEVEEEKNSEPIIHMKEGKVVFEPGQIIKTVYHEFNVAKPGINIDDVITILKENPWMRISIESHTDSKGSEEYNMDLSRLRASSCKTYLLTKSVSMSRITVKYYGETKPIAANTLSNGKDNPAGRDKNRRTEFIVITNKPTR